MGRALIISFSTVPPYTPRTEASKTPTNSPSLSKPHRYRRLQTGYCLSLHATTWAGLTQRNMAVRGFAARATAASAVACAAAISTGLMPLNIAKTLVRDFAQRTSFKPMRQEARGAAMTNTWFGAAPRVALEATYRQVGAAKWTKQTALIIRQRYQSVVALMFRLLRLFLRRLRPQFRRLRPSRLSLRRHVKGWAGETPSNKAIRWFAARVTMA